LYLKSVFVHDMSSGNPDVIDRSSRGLQRPWDSACEKATWGQAWLLTYWAVPRFPNGRSKRLQSRRASAAWRRARPLE